MQDRCDRELSHDSRGIIDMPLKLMIIMVILTLCIPIVAQAVDSNQKQMIGSVMDQEAERIIEAARSARFSGAGTSDIIDVDLPQGCEIVLGGDDPYSLSCIYEGSVISKKFMERPAIMFDDTITVSGSMRLQFRSTFIDGTYGTEVTVL